MKVAVTSASGKLGSAIIQHLKTEIGKENVIGIARTPSRAEHLGVEIRAGDYNSREQFNEALKGVDSCLILSGNDHPYNRIQQHRNIIEAAKSNGVSKLGYTSITGDEKDNDFSPIVRSNRQTEEDIRDSGLNWCIGRNGIYIEPDIEYIDEYIKEGSVTNCAGDGKCSYTTRKELAVAYTQMLLDDHHNRQTYYLGGEPVTQSVLVECLNKIYGTQLIYKPVSVEEYIRERKAALGDFLGTVIGGIYEGISTGAFDINPDFEIAAGRPHKTLEEMIRDIQ